MQLRDHLAAISSATDASSLEDLVQHAWKAFPAGRTNDRIFKAMRTRGAELAASSSHSRLIPTIGPHRRLTLCDKSYSVGFGGNAAGERYCWHFAKEWMRNQLILAGVSVLVAEEVIDWWSCGFPHRALRALERATP